MIRLAALLLVCFSASAQTDWPSFGNDPGAMRFSSLQQINAGNVGRLKPAWTFRMGSSHADSDGRVAGGAGPATMALVNRMPLATIRVMAFLKDMWTSAD